MNRVAGPWSYIFSTATATVPPRTNRYTESDKCLDLNKTDLCIVITNTTNKYKKQKQYAYLSVMYELI